MEWYNLACTHSPSQFLLLDDFYDDDGTAAQPEEDVVDAELFPAPTLEQVSEDVERLLDYARTKWSLDEQLLEVLSRHDKESIILTLQLLIASNPSLELKGFAYDICAKVLGRSAEEWIRQEWHSYSPALLMLLAEASAACLPHEEGYSLVVRALTELPPKELVHSAAVLSWFRSEATLDLLEHNVSNPLLADWGRLAAVSNLKWERVVKWLSSGRPLSLVALDALLACCHYDTPILKQFAPILLEPAPFKEAKAVLEQYLSTDQVPRVRNAVAAIIRNWEQICGPQPGT